MSQSRPPRPFVFGLLACLSVGGCGAALGPSLPTNFRGPNSGSSCPAGTVIRGAAPPLGEFIYCLKVGAKREDKSKRIGPVVSWNCSDCADGISLHGRYVLGARDGMWALVRKDGNKIEESQWHSGQRYGRRTAWYADGTPKFRTTYGKDGKRNGDAWARYPDGHYRFQGGYREDIRHGAWKTWAEGGKPIAEGSYDKGIRVGEWRLHDANGELHKHVWYRLGTAVREGVLVDGQLRISSLNAKGQKTATWSERAGNKHGVVVAYHPGTERVSRRTTYEMGVQNGPMSIHRKDGSKTAGGPLIDGKKQCEWAHFDRNGRDLSRAPAFARLLAASAAAAHVELPADHCAWSLDQLVVLRRATDQTTTIAIARFLVENELRRAEGNKLTAVPASNDARYEVVLALLRSAEERLAKLDFESAALLHVAALVESNRAMSGRLLNLAGGTNPPGSPKWPGPAADGPAVARFKASARGQLAGISTLLNEREKGERINRKAGRVTLGRIGLNKLTLRAFRKRLQ